jgi:hypothetical protein
MWVKYYFTPLKPALKNLENNISFLNLIPNRTTMPMMIGCDWCSICNGVMETVKHNVLNDPSLINLIDFKSLSVAFDYFEDALSSRSEKLSDKVIEEWCEKTFGSKTIKLLLLSKLYLQLELIELSWCPFKRSKETYYRNQDKRFLNPSEELYYEIGRILSSTDEIITCNNCPKVINETINHSSQPNSLFQPFLDYIIDDINSL